MVPQIIHRELVWLYPWLRSMASRLMASERRSHTLQPTALANEVLAKLLAWRGELSEDTEKSLRVLAITVAKQTLIDRGRRHTHRKQYVQRMREQLLRSDTPEHTQPAGGRVAIVLDAIERLESIDPDLATLIRLRFFEGYTHAEATEKLGLSPRTAARRWAFAKAYLADAISKSEAGG
jgi:RNA polymerase sigma factor (TIGR02999 family)